MKKILQIEPVAGIAGDMFVAACLGLLDSTDKAIDSLYDFLSFYMTRYCSGHHGLDLSSQTVKSFLVENNIISLIPVHRAGLSANYLALKTDLIYKYMKNEIQLGHEIKESSDYPSTEILDQPADLEANFEFNTDTASRHVHDQVLNYTKYSELDQVFTQGPLPSDRARDLARDILRNLATAEARVHGVPIQDVHFHEIAGLDSVIDIIGAAIALVELEADDGPIDFILSTPPPLGYGYIQSAHGMIPLPAPATLELVRGIPVNHTIIPYYQSLINEGANSKFEKQGHQPVWKSKSELETSPRLGLELTTPTGAAILKTLVTHFSDLPWDPVGLAGLGLSARQQIIVEKTSLAAGSMDLPFANICRLSLASIQSEVWPDDPEQIWQIETSIDDMNPELYPHLIDLLLTAGARDALLIPVIMKKGRPGNILQVLASENLLDTIERIIFKESTSIGLRKWPVDRTTLEQEIKIVDFANRPIRVKCAYLVDERGLRHLVNLAPEYADCLMVAQEIGCARSLKEIYQEVLRKASPR